MRPVVKSIHSPDIERPHLPEDPSNCQLLIEAEIGPKGEDGADIFSFVVSTPAQLSGSGPRWGRGLLILDSFSWDLVDTAVENLLNHCHGKDWAQVSVQLNKELHWEFENYQVDA